MIASDKCLTIDHEPAPQRPGARANYSPRSRFWAGGRQTGSNRHTGNCARSDCLTLGVHSTLRSRQHMWHLRERRETRTSDCKRACLRRQDLAQSFRVTQPPRSGGRSSKLSPMPMKRLDSCTVRAQRRGFGRFQQLIVRHDAALATSGGHNISPFSSMPIK